MGHIPGARDARVAFPEPMPARPAVAVQDRDRARVADVLKALRLAGGHDLVAVAHRRRQKSEDRRQKSEVRRYAGKV
jgi:hypothetical protein